MSAPEPYAAPAPEPYAALPEPAASQASVLTPPMAPATIDYPVFFVPQLAQAKAAAAKRNRNSRIVSLVISVAILGALYWFFRDQLGDLTWPVVAISLAFPLTYLAWAIIREVAARREASDVPEGLAMGICRDGLLLREGWLPWAEVGELAARNRRFGRSDDLVVTSTDGRRVALPLAYLSGKPATLDGAVKALSAGRVRIDFSKLDV